MPKKKRGRPPAKEPTRRITIHFPVADLELARKQAGAVGLPYQTYIRMQLHVMLKRTEQKLTGSEAI